MILAVEILEQLQVVGYVLVSQQQTALQTAHQVVYVDLLGAFDLLPLNHVLLMLLDVLPDILHHRLDQLHLQLHVGLPAEFLDGFTSLRKGRF